MIRPLLDRVLLKVPEPGTTAGGIHIPTGAMPEAPEGIVVSVGPKVEGLAEGDRVIFMPRAMGIHINDGEEKLWMCGAADIAGVRVIVRDVELRS